MHVRFSVTISRDHRNIQGNRERQASTRVWRAKHTIGGNCWSPASAKLLRFLFHSIAKQIIASKIKLLIWIVLASPTSYMYFISISQTIDREQRHDDWMSVGLGVKRGKKGLRSMLNAAPSPQQLLALHRRKAAAASKWEKCMKLWTQQLTVVEHKLCSARSRVVFFFIFCEKGKKRSPGCFFFNFHLMLIISCLIFIFSLFSLFA